MHANQVFTTLVLVPSTFISQAHVLSAHRLLSNHKITHVNVLLNLPTYALLLINYSIHYDIPAGTSVCETYLKNSIALNRKLIYPVTSYYYMIKGRKSS